MITSLSIAVSYTISLLGWLQTRINIDEENINNYKEFIHRFNLIGFGTLSIMIGFIFYFIDRLIQITDPTISILLLVGYILVFSGTMGFYFAFYKSDDNKNEK